MTALVNPPNPAPNPFDETAAPRPHGPWRTLVGLVWRGLVWLVQMCGFLAVPVDELVTAWLGVAPVLPRLRRWRQQLVSEWRVYRAVTAGDVIEGEVMDGVWR